jgi:hypothetical protein
MRYLQPAGSGGSDAIALDCDASPDQLAPVGLQKARPLESVEASVDASDQVGLRRRLLDHQAPDHAVVLRQNRIVIQAG